MEIRRPPSSAPTRALWTALGGALSLAGCGGDGAPGGLRDAGDAPGRVDAGELDPDAGAGEDAGPVDGGTDGGSDAGPDPVDGGPPAALACDPTVRVELDDVDSFGFPILSVLADGRAAATYHRTNLVPRVAGTSIFDPATGAWTELPGPRLWDVSRTAVLRRDADVWAFAHEGARMAYERRFDEAAGTWGDAVSTPAPPEISEPPVVVGRGGDAFQVARRSTVLMDVRRLGAEADAFDAPFVLEAGPARPNNPTVAVDGAGRALVLYQRNRGDGVWDFGLQVFDGDGWLVDGAGEPAPLTIPYDATALSALAMDVALAEDGGDGLMVYTPAGAGAVDIETRWIALGGGAPVVGPAETIAPDVRPTGIYQAAVAPGGDAIVVWSAPLGPINQFGVHWAIRTGGVWGPDIADPDGLVLQTGFRVVATAEGTFVLGVPTGARMVLRRLGSDGSIGDWVDVGSPATNVAHPQMAVDGAGDTHVIFSQFDEDAPRSSIFHTRCR